MLTKIINKVKGEYGFLDFGAIKVGEADDFAGEFSRYLDNGMCAEMDYLRQNVDKRFDPSLLVEDAQSILCFLAPYGGSEGGVAGFACGVDYHKVVKDKLFRVMADIGQEFPGFRGRAFVDSAPVLERYWAARAGIGFIGKNGFLISPQWGLRTIIGEIICNVPAVMFGSHAPLSVTECGSCGRCYAACPSGALGRDSIVDARKCVAYHTVESKEIYESHPVNYKGWIFGCEECLKVCPWNKPVDGWPEFETYRTRLKQISAQKWREMEPAEFDASFPDSGMRRAGLEKLKNNL